MVSKVGAADLYLQPCLDVDYLCEEWTSSMEPWYRRSRIATRAEDCGQEALYYRIRYSFGQT